ncbi:UPF0182 family protein [Propioniciclava sp. MC1683]|uniref:UPF0182 family membrane protein n=1 Tax=Propioniciclava sp. MC1683 TaxID=2760309 RepID=UPI001600D018|nr:UPF0182 family protein [Propioniciclava sp. MC1683]MBB1502163.1 UPF0182 family protein [Propioniciclava sp. MC1683]
MQAPASPRRSPLVVTAVILAAVLGAFLLFSGIWTEKLWFDSIGFTGVFWTQLVTRAVLFLVGALVVGGLLWVNMALAFRSRPQHRRTGASAVLDRYRDLLEQNALAALALPAGVFGFMAGLSTATQTLPVLGWLNRQTSGVTDPTFGLDTTFFMLEYPVWRLAASLLMSGLVFSFVAAAAVHFAVGNLGAGREPGRRATRPALVHLSVLGAAVLALYGLQNLLDRYALVLDQGTLFTGLHYTDDQARMNAKLVIAIIAFIVAVLFVVNIFWQRTVVPGAGVVLMVVSSLILSAIYPMIVQTLQVRPNEPDRENDYIAMHLEATKQAYGIEGTDITEYEAVTQVSPGQLAEDAAALPGIRLMDPQVIGPTFDQLQQVRGYYAFPEILDIDRYMIDEQMTDVVIAARELNQANIPDPNWNNIHTVYTHGHGFVSAYGNRRQGNGEPVWITRDIPPVGKIEEGQSRIYFGEQSDNFAIVGRAEGQQPIELDSPGGAEGGGEQYNEYDGTGGVPMGDLWHRLLYATRFADINILLSERVNENSRILYDRTPKQRVEKVAPWLTVDNNLYPAIVDGRLVWIVDAYTTSATYPNSQRVLLRDATSTTQTTVLGAQLDQPINYMRNSVKAVVDAYDGTVKLYQWDEEDPLVRTWAASFPGTVTPRSEISDDLLAHLRYPEDLFKVQRELLGRYHVDHPRVWYGGTDMWQVPVDPVQQNERLKEPTYYLSIKWPTDDEPVFSQTAVFVPQNRANLASYLAVNADASSDKYGELRILRMSDTQQIDGPGQTQNAITQNPEVAAKLLPYTQTRGSASIKFGNLLTLPMGNGLLYVEPIYTERTGSAGAYPALTFVVVRFGEHVGIGNTLQEALDLVFRGDAGAETGELPVGSGATPPPTTGETPAPTETPAPGQAPTGVVDEAAAVAAMQRAETAFTDAEAALRAGNLAEYQAKTNEAKAALEEAIRAMGR